MQNEANNDIGKSSAASERLDPKNAMESPPDVPAPQKPDEHVPPLEVPGRQDTPEPIPEKSRLSVFAYPVLVKNGKKTA